MSARPARDEAVLREADARARRLARGEFARPVVVAAGAGTGKTTIAVERIVAWSLGPGWERARGRGRERQARGGRAPDDGELARDVLSRVVAITFTEAAAAEMGTRVGEALVALERGETPEGFDAQALPPHGDARRARVRALLGALDQLPVRTIHAFCRRLLAEHPLEAGLHPRFAVDAEETGLKAAAREVLEEALPELLASDDAVLLAGRAQGPAEVEGALLALARQAVPPEALEADPLAPARIAALRARVLEVLDEFLAAEGGHIRGDSRAHAQAATAQLVAEARERAAGLATAGDLEALVAWLREVWRDKDRERVRTWARGELPSAATRALDPEARVALAAAAGPACDSLVHLASLDPPLLAAAHRVLAPLVRALEERLRRRGAETFPLLLRDARRLLAEHDAVCRKVRGRIDQLLVDEFQDTDRVQCDLVRRLVLDAPPDERPGLFLVGDPKQSIYGWRDADLEAYDAFVAEVRAAGGEPASLLVNHRSVPAVLAEVERVVRPVMHEERGVQPRFEPLLPSPARATHPGFTDGGRAPVEHWVSWAWDADARAPAGTNAARAADLEARALAADLVRLHRDHGVPWSDLGLLFRGTGDLETYLTALRRAEVPFVVEGDKSFYQRREIIEAAALVRAVLDPNDQLALLAVLRSAWVGVPDAALVPLWAHELPRVAGGLRGDTARDPARERARQRAREGARERAREGAREQAREGAREDWKKVRELVAAAAAELPDDVPGLGRVAGWEETLLDGLQTLAALRASFEADPADVFVERLRALPLLEATEAARYLGAYRVANLERFFRDLASALETGEGDPQAVLRAMRRDVAERREAEEGRPQEAAEDAVQVLTIHKAKGLAFRHVYVVQLHKGRGRGEDTRPEDLPADPGGPGRDPGGWELHLLGVPGLGWDRVLARRRRVEEAERVRTLYVALTRARDRLVVVGRHAGAGKAPPDESHVALLARRDPAPPDLTALMARCAAGDTAWADDAQARWVFPGLPAFPDAASRARSARGPALADPASVERGAEALARHRAAARAARDRPLHDAVSRMAHEAALESWREARVLDDAEAEQPALRAGEGDAPRAGADATAEPGGAGDRRSAQAVGTAVHRALELLEPAADPEAALDAARPVLDHVVRGLLPPSERDAARARAEALVRDFVRGPLGARLRGLGARLVARELPVLLPPAPDNDTGPAGFVSGTVDLLYRDPETGALVVADYKTDRIGKDADLDAKVRIYAAQGAGYVRAVQEALDLPAPPRFELWFLETGEVRRAE